MRKWSIRLDCFLGSNLWLGLYQQEHDGSYSANRTWHTGVIPAQDTKHTLNLLHRFTLNTHQSQVLANALTDNFCCLDQEFLRRHFTILVSQIAISTFGPEQVDVNPWLPRRLALLCGRPLLRTLETPTSRHPPFSYTPAQTTNSELNSSLMAHSSWSLGQK